jgi:hypothetical protein
MNGIMIALIILAVMYLTGLLCYWQGQRHGYADGLKHGLRKKLFSLFDEIEEDK